MTDKDFDDWARKFGAAWAKLDPDGALAMLNKNVKYYETAFSEPCSSWEKVEELWQVIPKNQKDVTFTHDVVMVKNNLGLIHWRVTRSTVPGNEHQEFDGVFLIELDESGLCTMFKQWRAIK